MKTLTGAEGPQEAKGGLCEGLEGPSHRRTYFPEIQSQRGAKAGKRKELSRLIFGKVCCLYSNERCT